MPYNRSLFAGALLMLGVCTSCLAQRMDLLREGRVCVNRSDSKHLDFKDLHVWQGDGETVVSGMVKRCSCCKQRICGGVRVHICDGAGTSLFNTETKLSQVRIGRHSPACSRFRVIVPFRLPAGPKVCVTDCCER